MLLVVEEGGANPVELELKSTNVKAYDEKDIISPKERRELRVKYVEALFAGISAGKFVSYKMETIKWTCGRSNWSQLASGLVDYGHGRSSLLRCVNLSENKNLLLFSFKFTGRMKKYMVQKGEQK